MLNTNQPTKRTPKEIRGALLGTLLGDSYITDGNQFGCEQINKELIERKRELLAHYNPNIASISSRTRVPLDICGHTAVPKTTYTIRMRHPRFRWWKKLLYRTGSKQLSINILKGLTLEGIALWIMDDGYMDYKPSNSTRNLRICTDSYDDISIKSIMQYFTEVHGIETKVYMHVSKKGCIPKPRISFNAKNAQKLIAKIFPYFIDSMLYKIDLHYLPETILSKRCSDEYRVAANYISQRKALLTSSEDIV